MLTLSSADLRCNGLIPIISKLHNTNLPAKDIEEIIPYNDRLKLFISNPFVVARHCQYGV